jgi:hypothetical protein
MFASIEVASESVCGWNIQIYNVHSVAGNDDTIDSPGSHLHHQEARRGREVVMSRDDVERFRQQG